MKKVFEIKDINERQNQIYQHFNKRILLPISLDRKKLIFLCGKIVSVIDKEQIKFFNYKRLKWIDWLEYYIKSYSS